MKYILLMYAVESIAQNFTPEEYQAAAQAWGDFGKEAQAAGVLLSSNGLSSVTDATTVRVRDGKTLTTDGPFAVGIFAAQRTASSRSLQSNK